MSFVIDDDYFMAMSTLTDEEGTAMEEAADAYFRIMKDVRNLAVISGDLSQALDTYCAFAGRLSESVKKISAQAGKTMEDYIMEIGAADRYV